jgi:hypothetical protein
VVDRVVIGVDPRAQALNRMHRLFLELVPGGAPVKKTASQYKCC